MERTCVIIKPDGVGKKVVGEILSRFEREGFKLLAMKMLWPERKILEEFYAVHKGKYFFDLFINFVSSGPIVVCAWEGEGAVKRVRDILGATNSKDAELGTLRQMFGTDGRRNLVHGSDSVENGINEINFFFKKNEIFEYDPDGWINK